MKKKKIPMRRCVGCNESRPKKELIRISSYEGNVGIDPTGKAPGRGIYLCPNPQCFQLARNRRAIGRSLNADISEERLGELFAELNEYAGKDS
ncbi:MAG: RNase P modulator RnpM [Anaerovoracaceae bacterium]|jgi:predicted RNA-binding protein YlxR (DUF448 family)